MVRAITIIICELLFYILVSPSNSKVVTTIDGVINSTILGSKYIIKPYRPINRLGI